MCLYCCVVCCGVRVLLPRARRRSHTQRSTNHTKTKSGASKARGRVLVPEHVPKVKDFYAKDCWAGHPLPYADFVAAKKKEAAALEAERAKAVRA